MLGATAAFTSNRADCTLKPSPGSVQQVSEMAGDREHVWYWYGHSHAAGGSRPHAGGRSSTACIRKLRAGQPTRSTKRGQSAARRVPGNRTARNRNRRPGWLCAMPRLRHADADRRHPGGNRRRCRAGAGVLTIGIFAEQRLTDTTDSDVNGWNARQRTIDERRATK